MRTARLFTVGALSAALLVPTAVSAQAPAGTAFTATITTKVYSKVRKVAVTVGKQNVPDGKTVNAYFVSETGSPNPLPGATGWRTLPTDFTVSDQDGLHTIYVWARATGGLVSVRGSDTVFLDRVAPTIDLFDVDPTASSRTITINDFVASDAGGAAASGVVKYAVVNGTTLPIASSTEWETSAPTTQKLTSGNGTKTITAFVKDRAGNVTSQTTTVALTVAAPTLTFNIVPLYTKSATVSINLTATDNSGAGIAGFIVQSSSTPPASTSTAWKVKPTSFVLPSVGLKTVYAFVKDNNGTVSAAASDTVVYDTAAPVPDFAFDDDTTTTRTTGVTTDFIAPVGADQAPVTHWLLKSGVTVPTASDPNWKAYPTNDLPTSFQLPLTGNGTKAASFWLKDAAGNVSTVVSDTIDMTLDAPVITSVTLASGATWFKSLTNVPLDVNVTVGSGLAVGGYCLQPAASPVPTAASCSTGWKSATTNTNTFSGLDGTKTLYVYAKDNNGTISNVGSDSVSIDTVKPTVAITVANDDTACAAFSIAGADAAGVANSGLTHYVARRTTNTAPGFPNSEWKTTPEAAVAAIALQEGANTINVWTRDAAGNVSLIDTDTVTVNTPVTTGC